MHVWKRIGIVVAALGAGWMLGASWPGEADAKARPKPKPAACKDDLTRAREQLVAAQAEAAAARADAAAARQERDAAIAREASRKERLEQQIGKPIEVLH